MRNKGHRKSLTHISLTHRKRNERKNGVQVTSEVINTENFPEFMKYMNTYIQKAKRILSKIEKKEILPRHTARIELQIPKSKKKILETEKEDRLL